MRLGRERWVFAWAAASFAVLSGACLHHVPPASAPDSADAGPGPKKGWDGTPHGHFFGFGAKPSAPAASPAPSLAAPPDGGVASPAPDAGPASDGGASAPPAPDAGDGFFRFVADGGADVHAPVSAETTPGAKLTAKRLWSLPLDGTGTSSPRLADLNGDGVLDVVLGGGTEGKGGYAIALDGRSGKVLWRYRLAMDAYATPALVDGNGDGVPDVVLGGRDFDMSAVNGKDGKPLWTFRKANPGVKIPLRNFNGATVVPDQNADGVDDLLLSQGGSYDDTKRVPGRLFLVSAAKGTLLVDLPMPDGRETYSIPLAVPGTTPLQVVFGTGGEILPGHLYRWDVGAKQALWGAASTGKGFIASPLLADLEGTGTLDAVTASFEGALLRLDGKTGAVTWEVRRPGFESYASPAVGAFGGSGALDVVTTFNQGIFPEYLWKNIVVWVDGKTGKVLDEKVKGVFGSASPIAADVDGDGFDEVFAMSMNTFTPWPGDALSTLTVFDGRPGRAVRLELRFSGAGASTPAVGDLDGDGTLDLVLTYFGRVERYALSVPGGGTPTVRWGGFRGTRFDGVAAPRAPAPPPSAP